MNKFKELPINREPTELKQAEVALQAAINKSDELGLAMQAAIAAYDNSLRVVAEARIRFYKAKREVPIKIPRSVVLRLRRF